jgi:peptide/nickel transport system substrate-binding protein
MDKKKLAFIVGLFVIAGLILVSCAQPEPETVEVIKTVIVTEMVEGEVVEVVVTEIVEVEVTPEVEEMGPATFNAEDPTLWTWVTFGDIDTLDPAWNYESFGDGFLEDIYDTLVDYQGPDATSFAPELATAWTISDDGMTYTFNIREGIKFHEGQDLTPEDVAYSFQRGILQGGGWSPQWLYTEAFFGNGVYDVAELVDPSGALDDDPESLQAADPALLLAACQQVVDAITFDDAAGTVTFQLIQPWGPLLSTIAGSWGSVLDKDWAIEHGTWDGDCATWQNYYGVTSENTPLRDITNGTGPYKLDYWTPGEEVVLVANDDYWLTEPLWEGGPTGAPRIKRAVTMEVDEWGTRFAMAQAGDATLVSVPEANYAQIDPLVGERCDYLSPGEWDCYLTDNPEGPLRLYYGYPLTSRTDAFFVFQINTDGGNPYIGSGQLDGNGIPPDFFNDEHVRKAFNYCFDWDAYINDALSGEGKQNFGPINQGLIGYDENAPHYSFDLAKCQEEIELAWDGQVAENGFRMQIGFNTGNVTRQTISSILQSNFASIDPKYNIEIIGLPWPSFLAAIRAQRLPVFVSGWGEDIHDPHNWAQPFLVGTYAARQKMPDWMFDEFNELVIAGVAGATAEERAPYYLEMQLKDYEYAPGIRLAVQTGRTYVQRWVNDWEYNPLVRQPFYWFGQE